MFRKALPIVACLIAGLASAAPKPLDLKPLKHGDLPYRLHVPKGDKDVPLVIFLHGAGERGSDNKAQLKHGIASILSWGEKTGNQFLLLVPQCPKDLWWTTTIRPSEDADPKETTGPLVSVLSLVDELVKKHSIDQKRIYLTGLSMGGFGSWELLRRKPDFFAAAIPICGGGSTKDAAKFKDVPLWVFHGDKDTVVGTDYSRKMVAALKKAGGKPKYTEYPGVAHDSWTQTYANDEVLAWLFSQKKK